ncbi:1-deoxy-D-xylulose-5-phosphate reductoisomerase, partial [Actinotignum timonense]|nr:1-deoxy-D-xylulose-5-phosphate reductoisomerase [Actinotignum timonense]
MVLLGSTGSIGTQALDIVRANPLRFDIRGLAAGGGNIERLARQVVEFDVPVVSVDRRVGGELRDAIHTIDSSAHPQII